MKQQTRDRVEHSLITVIVIILLLTTFVSCEAPQEEGESSTPRITVVDTETEEVIVAETPEELQELAILGAGDYKSDCVDGEKYLIEIKEAWNGEKLELTTESYPHNDCYVDIDDPSTYATLNVEEITSEDFYGDHLVIKSGDNYNIDGIEFIKE